MKRKRNLNFLIGTCSFIALLAAAYALVFSHDVFLWEMKNSLSGTDHPAHSKRVASAQKLGLLAGNGNHCDYFVAELRNYNAALTPPKIKAFYKNRRIWNPLKAKYQRVSLGFIENGRIATDDDWTGAGKFLQDRFKTDLPQKLKSQRFYFVFLLNVGNEIGCDFRCS